MGHGSQHRVAIDAIKKGRLAEARSVSFLGQFLLKDFCSLQDLPP